MKRVGTEDMTFLFHFPLEVRTTKTSFSNSFCGHEGVGRRGRSGSPTVSHNTSYATGKD